MDALRSAGCEKIYTEKVSGSHRDRPQLKAALNFLRKGDTLVVWKLSRLARSLTQIMKTAADINERGIALKVLTQNIDTTTPGGRLFFHMTAAFDEFQKELIVENTRAGLKAANKRGRRGGRPNMNEPSSRPRHCSKIQKTTPSLEMSSISLKLVAQLSTAIFHQIVSNSSEMSMPTPFIYTKSCETFGTFMQMDPMMSRPAAYWIGSKPRVLSKSPKVNAAWPMGDNTRPPVFYWVINSHKPEYSPIHYWWGTILNKLYFK